MHEEPFQDMVDRKRANRMRAIDDLPPEIRELVHEYGYAAVHALLVCGVKKANQIKHCIETVLDEFSPTRGSYSAQGVRKDVQSGCIARFVAKPSVTIEASK